MVLMMASKLLVLLACQCVCWHLAYGQKDKAEAMTMKDMQNIILDLVDTVSQLHSTVEQYESRFELLNEENVELRKTIDLSTTPEPYVDNSFGCLSDTIPLSCDGGKLIHIESARYGMYINPCDEACCSPNTGRDCYESVQESRPQDWAALLLLCENKTNCEYEYLGSVIESCSVSYIADYMIIYFTCIPEDTAGPVGFLACHVDDNHEYASYDVIQFGIIKTNIGLGFQEDLHTFICPRDGIFMFSVNVQAAIGKQGMIRLMKNSSPILHIWADNDAEAHGQASNVAIVECNRFEQVYVEAHEASTVHGTWCRTSFSGYLLHSF